MQNLATLLNVQRRIELTRYHLVSGDRLVLVFMQYSDESDTPPPGLRELVLMHPENVVVKDVTTPSLLLSVMHSPGPTAHHAVFHFAASARIELNFSSICILK